MRSRWRVFWALLLALTCAQQTPAQTKRARLPPVDTINHVQLLEMVRRDSGKVHLINVWATWCKPCREEIPTLLRLRRELRKRGFALTLVSADDVEITDGKVKPMLRQFGVEFQTYIMQDVNDEAFIRGMSPDWSGALPTSFIYDKHGALVDMIVGEKKYEQFKAGLEKLLNR